MKDVPSIFISDSHGYYKDDIDNALIIFVAIVICSIIPYMLVLDSGFVRIFKIEQKESRNNTYLLGRRSSYEDSKPSDLNSGFNYAVGSSSKDAFRKAMTNEKRSENEGDPLLNQLY